MFPKITNFIELTSEDDVWDALRSGRHVKVLVLKTCGVGSKYEAGYRTISYIDTVIELIEMRKAGYPIIFIKEDYIDEE